MSEYTFIRPFKPDYRDMTEKVLNEREEEIPLKFRQPRKPQEYIKKPNKYTQMLVQNLLPERPPQLQPEPPKGCWESFFSCCPAKKEKPQQQPSGHTGDEKPSGLEFCEPCLKLLCAECRGKQLQRDPVCKNCKSALCETCRKKVTFPAEPLSIPFNPHQFGAEKFLRPATEAQQQQARKGDDLLGNFVVSQVHQMRLDF